ncbi:MAG TPA: ABC transporter permease subunit, partial [Phycisphaeraceae bacterium]
MIEQLLTIARNTFTESIRQPIFLVLVLLGGAALVLNPALTAYTMEDDNKLLVDLSLSTILLVGLMLAAFSATSVLASELENRTVLTVVSKPVARPIFVLGKYLGVLAAIALAFYVLSLVFLLTCRHGVMSTASHRFDGPVLLFGTLAAVIALGVATLGNYLYRWVFSSTMIVGLALAGTVAIALVLVINKQWAFQSPLTEFTAHDGRLVQIILGLGMVFQSVAILAAVAIAASTRLGQIMTLVISAGVFLMGLITNSFSQLINDRLKIPQGLGAAASLQAIAGMDLPLHLKLTYSLGKVLYLLFPNLQFLWPADA